MQPGPGLLVDAVSANGAGPVGDQLGIDQELGDARRPTLPWLVGDRVELPEQVHAAQRMGDLVAPIRRPAVVHRDPSEPRQHPGRVRRHLAPLGMHAEQAQQAGRPAGAGARASSTPVPAARARSRRRRVPARGRPRRWWPRRRTGAARPGARPHPSAVAAGRTPAGPRPRLPARWSAPRRSRCTGPGRARQARQAGRLGPDGRRARRAACRAGAARPARQPAAPPARACAGRLRTAAWTSSRSPCRADPPARPPAPAAWRSAGPARRWTRATRR
jgi:hypothetical protein